MTDRRDIAPTFDDCEDCGLDGTLRTGPHPGIEWTWAEVDAAREFQRRLGQFYSAGMRLVDAWDIGPGINADDVWPLPERLKPPLSLDEWFMELLAHYQNES